MMCPPYYRDSLKECTRKFWPVRDEKANAATHILGCYKGIVKEAIRISSVFMSEDEYPGRKVFEGEELKDSPYLGMDRGESAGGRRFKTNILGDSIAFLLINYKSPILLFGF